MAWHLASGLRTIVGLLVRYVPSDPFVGRTTVEMLRQVLLSGASVTAPFVVTVLVLGFIVDFVAGILAPFARALTFLGLTAGQHGIVAQVVTVSLLLAFVFLAGVIAESGSATGLERRLGSAVEALPGVGSVYSSFDRMKEVMLDGDTPSFREVKLVEFPHANVYSLAFQTSAVQEAALGGEGGEEMLVLFVPLAPNPVMGGFMVCVPTDRVRDVDMTVQEAFQAIITSGVAMTDSSRQDVDVDAGLTP